MKFFTQNNKQKEDRSDEELLAEYKSTNHSEYFGILYNRYIPLIYGLCLKYLQEEEKAQDAVMDIFENLLSRINNYEIKVFRTWIYSVAKNHCFQILEKNKRELVVDFNTQIMESDEVLSLLDELKDEDRENILKQCIEKLPDPQKMSILCFFMENMSYVEVAEHTGYNLKSVKSYIQNGKRNLKICVERNEKELA